MPEHQPGLVQKDRGRLAVQRPLDAAEQVEQRRQGVLLAERHQFLDLEHGEVGEREAVFLGIEQVAHRAVDRVLPDRLADRLVLDRHRELGERACAAVVHAGDGLGDLVALGRRRLDLVERQQGVDPLHRPGPVAAGLQKLQRTERQRLVVGRHGEVLAAGGLGQRVQRQPLVEGVDRHAAVAPELRRDQRQVRRLAGTGRAEQEGVAEVAHMQVEPERRGAVRHAVHQRRRERRVHRTGRSLAPGPDRARRQQVGQVHGVDERTAHVLDAVAGQAAEKGLHRVDGLDAGGEAEAVDGLLHLPRGGAEPLPVLVHQDHDAGVVALGDEAAVDLGDGRFGVGHHRQRVLVDRPGVGVEHLVEEAAHLLPPLPAEVVEVLHRFVGVHEDEARRPAVLARQLAEGGQDARRGLEREALDGDHLDELPADARAPRRPTAPGRPRAASRYIGLLGSSTGWSRPVTQNCSQRRRSSWVTVEPSSAIDLAAAQTLELDALTTGAIRCLRTRA